MESFDPVYTREEEEEEEKLGIVFRSYEKYIITTISNENLS